MPTGDLRSSSEALSELQQLAETADFVPAGCMVQHRRIPDPHGYLGAGKLAELAEVVKQEHSGSVICDDTLTPNKARKLFVAWLICLTEVEKKSKCLFLQKMQKKPKSLELTSQV